MKLAMRIARTRAVKLRRVAWILMLSSAGVLWCAPSAHAQLAVDTSLSPYELVTQIFAGSTAVISNIQYTGASGAIGSFNAASTNLGVDEGILLTTGGVINAVGPNNDTSKTRENFTGGDPNLDSLYGISVQDAAVLEFDFYSFADRISFEYVFGSEEYPEFVGSIYNDIFAFFISGPGYPGPENIALIPGTGVPVSINTVNQFSNAAYFIDNAGGPTIQYDGFTTVLTAEANVIPCETYHLKIAIADLADFKYDSGVFLKAKSFESGGSVEITRTRDAYEGCGRGLFEIVRIGGSEFPITFAYEITGTATKDVDYVGLTGSVYYEAEQDTAILTFEALKDEIPNEYESVMIRIRNNCGVYVDSATVYLHESEFFQTTIAGDTAICRGDAVDLRATINGGSGRFRYDWQPGFLEQTAILDFPDTSTTYIFTVFDSSNGCIATDTLRVKVYNVEADAGEDIYKCPLDEVPIGGPASGGRGPYSYQWLPTEGLSSGSEPIPLASPKVSTEYILIVTDDAGCVDFDTVLVEVSTLLVEAPPDTFVCYGGSMEVPVHAEGGKPGYRYEWSPPNGVSDLTSARPVLRPQKTTKYFVTVYDQLGCSNVDSITITVDPELIAKAGQDQSTCPGIPVQIGGLTQGGTPPYTFDWNPKSGLINPESEQPLALPESTTAYEVRVIDAHGCESRDVVLVSIDPTVTVAASRDTTICEGSEAQIRAYAEGGEPPYSFDWNPQEGILIDNDSMLTVSPSQSTTYTVVAMDSKGCIYVDSVRVNVRALEDIGIAAEGPTRFCNGGSVTLTADSGYSAYEWSDGEKTRSIVVSRTGTYGVTATEPGGCVTHSDSITVTVETLPDLTIAGPSTVCVNSKSVYTVKPAPSELSYDWKVIGGTVSSTLHGAVTIAWDQVTMASIQLIVENPASGCTDTIRYEVEVSTSIVPVITTDGPTTTCLGDTIVLDAGAGFESYFWSTGDSTQRITVFVPGSYTVTVQDSVGCSGTSDPFQVDFTRLDPPKLAIIGDTLICAGDSVEIQAPMGFESYLWSNNEDTTYSITIGEEGVYSVQVWDSLRCTAISESVRVKVIDLPEQEIVGPRITCAGTDVQYSVITDPDQRITWLIQGGVILNDPTEPVINVRWTQTGMGIITLDIETAGVKCAGLYTYEVEIVEDFTFEIEIEGSTDLCEGESVRLSGPDGFGSYEWSNGERTSSIVVTEPGSYSLLITDTDGCTGRSDTVTVTVQPAPSPQITAAGALIFCEGDSVILRSKDVYPTYEWSTGSADRIIPVKSSGTYWLRAWNIQGCSRADTVEVIVNPVPSPVITGPASVCLNELATYIVPPVTGNSYTWTANGGTIQSGQGTNEVEVLWTSEGGTSLSVVETVGSGCSGTSSPYSVTVNPLPIPTVTQNGDTLVSSPAVSYQWLRNGSPVGGATAQRYIPTLPGGYSVTVTDVNGCEGTSDISNFEVTAESYLATPDMSAEPGTRITIPILVSGSESFVEGLTTSFSGKLRVDASLLSPINQTPTGWLERGERVVPFNGTLNGIGDTLATFDFLTMLGSVKSTPIRITEFSWDNPLVSVQTTDGVFTIIACEEGGIRLVDLSARLQLQQNRPNPFNAATVIEFQTIERGVTKLHVVDMLGRTVETLVDEYLEPGSYSVFFQAERLSTGTYMYLLQTPTQQVYKLMEVVK